MQSNALESREKPRGSDSTWKIVRGYRSRSTCPRPSVWVSEYSTKPSAWSPRSVWMDKLRRAVTKRMRASLRSVSRTCSQTRAQCLYSQSVLPTDYQSSSSHTTTTRPSVGIPAPQDAWTMTSLESCTGSLKSIVSASRSFASAPNGSKATAFASAS